MVVLHDYNHTSLLFIYYREINTSKSIVKSSHFIFTRLRRAEGMVPTARTGRIKAKLR